MATASIRPPAVRFGLFARLPSFAEIVPLSTGVRIQGRATFVEIQSRMTAVQIEALRTLVDVTDHGAIVTLDEHHGDADLHPRSNNKVTLNYGD